MHAVQQATQEQAPAEHSQAGTPGCGGALRACSARNSARFMKRLDSEAVMHLVSVPHGCPAVFVARYVGPQVRGDDAETTAVRLSSAAATGGAMRGIGSNAQEQRRRHEKPRAGGGIRPFRARLRIGEARPQTREALRSAA